MPESLPKPPAELAHRFGYSFRDPGILELALIHKSYGNEQRGELPLKERDNERFEFLGDAVLDLIISQLLLDHFPDAPEGELSKLRAGLVNERVLARLARDLGLGDFVWLGKGEEQTGGRDKDSILASTLEAVVAAVYADGGYAEAEKWVRTHFLDRIRSSREEDSLQDYKTRLQEVVQARFRVAPRYEVVDASGPDHAKTFEVRLSINGKVAATATGKSKKEAEQGAARAVFEKYGPNVDF